MGLLLWCTFEKPLASSRSVTALTRFESIGPQNTAKNLAEPKDRVAMYAGNCKPSIFLAADWALSSRSKRPTHRYMELVITEFAPSPFEEFGVAA